jgi:predicted ATPase
MRRRAGARDPARGAVGRGDATPERDPSGFVKRLLRRSVEKRTEAEGIYSIDDERTMSFEATLDFHRAIVDAYRDADYDLVAVPRASVHDRAAFVGGHIASAAGAQ